MPVLILFAAACSSKVVTVSTSKESFNEIEVIIGYNKKVVPLNFPYEYELDYRAERVYFYSCDLTCQDSITFKIR